MGKRATTTRGKPRKTRSIGFRCLTDGFAFVVLEGSQTNATAIAYDRYFFPKGMERAPALAWLRKQVRELCSHYTPSRASLKVAEPLTRKKSLKRSELEGVVQEAVFSAINKSAVPRMKTQLRRDIKAFTQPARYLERVLDEEQFADLRKPYLDEATWAAISALPED